MKIWHEPDIVFTYKPSKKTFQQKIDYYRLKVSL